MKTRYKNANNLGARSQQVTTCSITTFDWTKPQKLYLYESEETRRKNGKLDKYEADETISLLTAEMQF